MHIHGLRSHGSERQSGGGGGPMESAYRTVTGLVPPDSDIQLGWIAAALLIPIVASFAGSYVAKLHRDDDHWYRDLRKPWFVPHATWVFGAVWIPLFVCTGFASWLVVAWTTSYSSPPFVASAVFYAPLIVLIFLWPVVFFGFHALLGGMLVTVLTLACALGACVSFAFVVPLAAKILSPLVVWLGYASAAGVALWRINRAEGSRVLLL